MPDNDTFKTTDDTTISFTLHAAPRRDAPRIVLIHSLAFDRTVWDDVVATLGNAAQVLTYDCRGHGESERKAGAFTAELFAHDLAELLDHVGWQSATIAGCSMGGCVALAFAGLYPPRAMGLGLIDTTAWYGADAAEKFAERAAVARAKGMRGLIDFQVTRWVSDTFRARNAKALDRAIAVFVGNNIDCYAETCALLGNVDVRPYLRSFRIPVAIVVGEEDYATPVAMARHLHEEIAESTLTILPHARHLTPLEHPDLIASELLALLRRA